MKSRRKWFVGCGGLALSLAVACAVLFWLARGVLLGPEGAYFDSAGVRIHYTDEGEGVPVLLVHGLAFTAHLEWQRPGIIEALSESHRVITLDARGHGRSGKPHDPGEYGTAMVEDMVRLLDHLRIEKAHVAGLSMGGFLTLKMVETHPGRIRSAVICAAGWEAPTEENQAFCEAVAQALEDGEGIGPLGERLGLESGLEKLGVRLGIRFFNDPIALAAVVRGFPELAVSEESLRANQIPVITIIGREDGFLPSAEALSERLANNDLVVLEGINHMNIGRDELFLMRLKSFIDEHK